MARSQVLRVMAVFGTRPEGVKMAPLVRELRSFPDQIRLTVAVTGQHREMLDQILQAFGIVPDYDLDIMRPGQTLAEITCRSLSGLDGLLERESPEIVLAQGDTTTTFVASLAAFYRKIDFGHVEAGLRSDNRWEPFPEEMNRRMVSLCASLHFAPTGLARDRLLQEGVPAEDVYLTGNTVIDALQEIASRDEPLQDAALAQWVGQGRLLLVTAHRRENWGAPMEAICRAIRRVADAVEDARVVFAMHRNPVVRQTVHAVLDGHSRVRLIEPPDYLEFVRLMKRSYLILTDSGGVQEEAPSLGVPVLVLRNTTERPEGVLAGNARLVGANEDRIVSETLGLMENANKRALMARAANPYGDGKASQRIRRILFDRYGLVE